MAKNLGMMEIYKPSRGDCSNHGISSKFEKVKIWSDFDEDAPENAVVVVKDVCLGEWRMRAIPANRPATLSPCSMFGGCFIYTSNGCVPYSGEPIALHDRYE